jgi:membrane dipeptidase
MDARELTHDALVIDCHNDSIALHIRRGNQSIAREGATVQQPYPGMIDALYGLYDEPRRSMASQFSIPKMRMAGLDVAFCAIDVTKYRKNELSAALDAFGYLMSDLDETKTGVTIVHKADDILAARAQGHPALLLAIEHADATDRSLNILRMLYEAGVRSIGLTHNLSSWAADGNGEARESVGLTRYGAHLVREMNRLGMVVDLAHVSESAFFSALETSTKPVLFSHGNARALCDHPRNLTDEELRALARNGGVIGLSFVPMFIDQEKPTLDRFFDHVDHIVKVAGADYVGLGSDFDGGGTVLESVTELWQVTAGLLRRGYAEADIRKILGDNVLRVLKATIG